jgi:protoporphyrinogen/coproporphyrinogen III oxidase
VSGTERVEAAVVGAGAAGLAAALELEAQGAEVLLVDAAPRVGGVMQTSRAAGFLFERGPNTFRVTAPALKLLRRAGLEAALLAASPASRARFVYRDGGLDAVPLGPLAFLGSRLLSPGAKLRLLAEPFVRRGDAAGETVAEFLGRRLGPEVVERLVGPFLVGVYAGDERRLGAEAVFPGLVALERERGSLALGALARAWRDGARGLPGTWSTRGGAQGLAVHLAGALHGPRALGAPVAELARESGAWRLVFAGPDGGREIAARGVVLAADAAGSAALLRGVDPEAAELLATLAYAPLVSVALGVDPRAAARPIEGFGFLVPRDAGIDLLGALFMSRLFPGRAPEGRALVTAMIGGLRWPGAAEADEDEILARVAAGLERTLGLRGGMDPLAVSRWPRAVPQPGPEHVGRIAALRARAARLGGLALAGAYLDGVGVADTLASGVRAALEPALAAALAPRS